MHRYIRILSFSAFVLTTVGLAVPADAQVRARSRVATSEVATPQSTRAVDMFIKIEGVEGEATDANHDKWIDVLSVDWGGTNTSRRQRGPLGNGSGTVTLTRSVDRATPKLSEACTSGRSLGSIVVHLPENGAYREYVLDEARVASCSQGGSGDRPTETIALNYTKVSSSEGNPDRPIVVGR